MAKKQYYAVRLGRIAGIYETWTQCEEQVKGFPGAEYKSFPTIQEAERYIGGADEQGGTSESVNEINAQIEKAITNLKENEVIAFVDGSYDVKEEKSAFGVIVLDSNGNKETLYKAFTKNLGEEFIALRNVAAELEGVKEAINWAIKYNKEKITIYFDYEGIGRWATGAWKAKNQITQDYVNFIADRRKKVDISFVKVPAHAGIGLNEEVDSIAKNALLEKGFKTYNDGSVYFVGYSVDDWKAIVQYLNDENMNLDENEIAPIEIVSIDEFESNRKKIRILQANNVVTINCYNNSRSFVQGKQTVLFQKLIASAIERLTNKQIVVETLNRYHALTITPEEVENKFEQLVPHYRHDTKKHYYNLLTGVYNTMLTGYMPDYTCLVTPIFRAYEYYLHKILGEKMQLSTENDKGTNNFSFFSRKTDGSYECNSSSRNVLSADQLNYLNALYTTYNGVRHPFSHWSASDVDVAVITEMEEARNYLLDAFALIEQYYILF